MFCEQFARATRRVSSSKLHFVFDAESWFERTEKEAWAKEFLLGFARANRRSLEQTLPGPERNTHLHWQSLGILGSPFLIKITLLKVPVLSITQWISQPKILHFSFWKQSNRLLKRWGICLKWPISQLCRRKLLIWNTKRSPYTSWLLGAHRVFDLAQKVQWA